MHDSDHNGIVRICVPFLSDVRFEYIVYVTLCGIVFFPLQECKNSSKVTCGLSHLLNLTFEAQVKSTLGTEETKGQQATD